MPASQTYFRLHPHDQDPKRLLDPDQQQSEPWSGTIHGRCDKCHGEGETEHECQSCAASGADPGCPACHGDVRYRGRCPTCGGSGEIDDSSRDGISVFPDENGLLRYMLERDADLDRALVVELEGEPTEEEDFDADEGALLIRPTRLVRSSRVSSRQVDRARSQRD